MRKRSAGSTPFFTNVKGEPVQAELDSAMNTRSRELTMQVELLEANMETFGPLGRRWSRR